MTVKVMDGEISLLMQVCEAERRGNVCLQEGQWIPHLIDPAKSLIEKGYITRFGKGQEMLRATEEGLKKYDKLVKSYQRTHALSIELV